MSRRFPWMFYVIFGLIAIGILAQFTQNPVGMLVPLVVFGVVFVLYKYPPRSWQRGKPFMSSMRSSGKDKSGIRSKKGRFRVIEGSKKDDDDDNTPRYH